MKLLCACAALPLVAGTQGLGGLLDAFESGLGHNNLAHVGAAVAHNAMLRSQAHAEAHDDEPIVNASQISGSLNISSLPVVDPMDIESAPLPPPVVDMADVGTLRPPQPPHKRSPFSIFSDDDDMIANRGHHHAQRPMPPPPALDFPSSIFDADDSAAGPVPPLPPMAAMRNPGIDSYENDDDSLDGLASDIANEFSLGMDNDDDGMMGPVMDGPLFGEGSQLRRYRHHMRRGGKHHRRRRHHGFGGGIGEHSGEGPMSDLGLGGSGLGDLFGDLLGPSSTIAVSVIPFGFGGSNSSLANITSSDDNDNQDGDGDDDDDLFQFLMNHTETSNSTVADGAPVVDDSSDNFNGDNDDDDMNSDDNDTEDTDEQETTTTSTAAPSTTISTSSTTGEDSL